MKTTHKGGAEKVTVKTQAGCAWTATSGLSWVAIASGASGIGNGLVTLTIAPSEDDRAGSIIVAGREVQVEQKGR